ncbi:CHAP domain-containing protein, partial [Nonomuraea sp. RK-328]|nr:CHAP domain-containing protein [Nonomuraea sp. RK-328]
VDPPPQNDAPLQKSSPVEGAPPREDAPAPKAAPVQNKALLTADALLKVAKSQLGVKENRAGGGTRFHRWYMSSSRAAQTVARDGGSVRSYRNAPWCAMFVSWVGEKAGMRETVGADAYTVTYARWFKRHKRWGKAAKRGAVVFFSWNGGRIPSIDHVGLVKKDNGNGTITTIEGNTGDGRVQQRIRPKSTVVGYGYPEYQS